MKDESCSCNFDDTGSNRSQVAWHGHALRVAIRRCCQSGTSITRAVKGHVSLSCWSKAKHLKTQDFSRQTTIIARVISRRNRHCVSNSCCQQQIRIKNGGSLSGGLSCCCYFVNSELPHSLICCVKTTTARIKRPRDVACNSQAKFYSTCELCAGRFGSFARRKNMKARVEEKYK